MKTPITLTIAGSDSGGGAGIQADIKAISATGGYACSVITALTAQNTQGVSGILPIPTDFIAAQLDAVFSDLDVQAVKIGMLADPQIIELIAKKLKQYQPQWIVLDPVMVATSGDVLLPAEAIDSLKTHLLPLAHLITPNLPEAAKLFDVAMPNKQHEMQQMVGTCQAMLQPQQAILLKGGHLTAERTSDDLLVSADDYQIFSAERIDTQNTHGTGCSLSAAIASYLAQGFTMPEAVAKAKAYLTQALRYADDWQIGQGHGPVAHFYMLHGVSDDSN